MGNPGQIINNVNAIGGTGGSPSDTPGCPTFSTKHRSVLDTSELVLTASYQTRFSYSGSGKLIGYMIEVENTDTDIKLTIDSEVLFELKFIDLGNMTGNKEFSLGSLYTNATAKRLIFLPECPIAYTTNITVELKETTGKKVFRSMAVLTKET